MAATGGDAYIQDSYSESQTVWVRSIDPKAKRKLEDALDNQAWLLADDYTGSSTNKTVTGGNLKFPLSSNEVAEQSTPVPAEDCLDGIVESIDGTLALVVFNAPSGFVERYVDVTRLISKRAGYPGARIRLITKPLGDAVISELVNISDKVKPAWTIEDKEFDTLGSELKEIQKNKNQ